MKRMKKHIKIMLSVLLLSITCMACGSGEVMEISDTGKTGMENILNKGRVGVLMPEKTIDRWERDAENIRKGLEEHGYQVDVQFAEDTEYSQRDQMKEMLEEGVECLVINPVDSELLAETLEQAKQQKVSVISYERLLMNTDVVSYYATFDNKNVGVSIGTYIKEKQELDKIREEGGHKTIEFFMGSHDDNNSILVYQGIMEVLREYLNDGTLVCNSKKTEFEDTTIMGWSKYTAQEEATKILKNSYESEKVDIMCCANDSIALGVICALEEEGYTQEDWPVITGQDADVGAVKNIIEGKQAMSLYKDTRLLADKCVTMVRAELEGIKPEINNRDTCYNGKVTVPAYLCTSVVVDKDNYQEILMDSTYYELD